MKRRKFIFCILGGSAAGLYGWKLLPSRWGLDNYKSIGTLAKVSRSSHALGTNVVISAFHREVSVAENAIAQAFKAIEHVEQLMSLYRPDSQLSQLNRDGFLANPHPNFVRVLERAAILSEQSQGAFDVTIQPLWNAYQDAKVTKGLPTQSAISDALEKVDWRKVEFSSQRISLRGKDMAITLNGIAQGFAADAARQALRTNGVDNALIDSGEIGTVGTPARKNEWAIGIKHPRAPKELLGLTKLKGRCLATSGDYETTFSDDLRHHHLLDPRTGRSPLDLSSVSVVAPTAMEADALSTAVFLMGLQKGKELIESMPNVDALFVDKSNRLIQTAGYPFVA